MVTLTKCCSITRNLQDNQLLTDLQLRVHSESERDVQSTRAESDYNPFEHRNVEHTTTVLGAIIHLLKACLGTGLLAMPSAFKHSGYVVGVFGVFFTGLLCTHTVYVLVRTAQEVCVDARKPSMSFAETCGAAFTYGPSRFKSWGPTFKVIVDYALALCYIGVLCVYVVFIGSSLKEVMDVYTDVDLSIQTYCAMTLIPLGVICQVRNLKFLVPFSGVANFCILIVFFIILYYIFIDLPSISGRKIIANISQWPLFFSTVVFAIEGIGVVMPVENEMECPERFLGSFGVLNISMVIVTVLYAVVGFLGYLKYGDTVKGSITLSLPKEDVVAQSTKLLMAFVMFLSYTIQFYVPMEMITRTMKDKRNSNDYENILQISIRIAIVCFSVGVAAACPNLELIISFVGAIFFSTFGLFCPALVETIYRWERDLGYLNYILWKNIIVAIISIIALVSGTYQSVVELIHEYKS